MPTQLQFRRGNTVQTTAFTGANGEVTVDFTRQTLVVHDGATPGGSPLCNLQNANNINTTAQVAATTANNNANLSFLYALAF